MFNQDRKLFIDQNNINTRLNMIKALLGRVGG